ncbi:hypothetical protein DFH28DRAFT_1120371 [Melampsora americana]|nr:hypothetical protein DFH28DRAFT_1120371 [Melampsora americana]
MNSEASLNFGTLPLPPLIALILIIVYFAGFNSRGSQSQEFVNSGQGATTSPSSSLPGFNNHGALRDTAGGFVDSPRGRTAMGEYPWVFNSQQTPHSEAHPVRSPFPPGSCIRSDRSMSPSGPMQPTGHWPDRYRGPGSIHRRDSAPNQGLGGNDRSGIETSMYACPLAGQSLENFQTMAEKWGLDGDYCAFAMGQAEVFGETNRHLAQATVQGLLLMQVSRLNGKIETLTDNLAQVTHKLQELTTPPAPAMPDSRQSNAAASNETTPIREWAPGQVLLDVMNPLALKLLLSPQLSAYTATENKPEGFLVDSLFNTIKRTISKESPPFAALHLPPQYGGVETSADAQSYASAIRNSGKQAREKMHNVLLLGIHDPKTRKDVDIPVPSIKDLVQRVAVKCGTAQNNAAVNVVWNATNLLTRGRISYLRREAARLVKKGGKGCESIWAVVDKRLAHVRQAKDEDYKTAFYQIIFDKDCQIFDGKAWFKDLKAANINLGLPSEERIRARMPGGADFTGSASNTSSQMQPNV